LITGGQFRPSVSRLIPPIAAITFLSGISSHYLVQAFYLSLRPNLMLWAFAPASAVTLVLNFALVPFFGLWGAVASGGASQIVLMIGLLAFGRRVFPLPLPSGPITAIAIATACMSGLIYLTRTPVSWTGLLGEVAVGCISYALVLLLLSSTVVDLGFRFSLPAKYRMLWKKAGVPPDS
jgi:O-antigen/teichoic acid export membrane protein